MNFDYVSAFSLLGEKFSNIIRSPSPEEFDILNVICKDEEKDNAVYVDEKIGERIERFKNDTRNFKFTGLGNVVEYCGIKYNCIESFGFGRLDDSEKDEVFRAMELISRNITEYSIRTQVLEVFPSGELRLFTSGQNYKLKTDWKRTTNNRYGRYSEKGKGRKYIGKKYIDLFRGMMMLRDKIKSELEGFRKMLESGMRVLMELLKIRLDLGSISKKVAMQKLQSEKNIDLRKSQFKGPAGENDRKKKSVTVKSDYVASRLESIYVNLLEMMNIPHLCEEALSLNPGHRSPYRVDVTYDRLISHGQDSKVYVELFGMIDKDDYYGTAYDKMANYSRCGINIGKNLICFVCGNSAVNANVMNQVIVMSLFGFTPVDYVVV